MGHPVFRTPEEAAQAAEIEAKAAGITNLSAVMHSAPDGYGVGDGIEEYVAVTQRASEAVGSNVPVEQRREGYEPVEGGVTSDPSVHNLSEDDEKKFNFTDVDKFVAGVVSVDDDSEEVDDDDEPGESEAAEKFEEAGVEVEVEPDLEPHATDG